MDLKSLKELWLETNMLRQLAHAATNRFDQALSKLVAELEKVEPKKKEPEDG